MGNSTSISEDKLKQIEEILKRFNWEKTLKVMRFLNWKWCSTDSEDGIPTLYDLIEAARGHLQEVAVRGSKDEYSSVHSGGLKATNRYGNLGLSFVLTDYEVEG